MTARSMIIQIFVDLFIYLFIYLSIYDSRFEKTLFIIKIFLENGRTCYLVGVTRTVAQQY